MSFSSSAFVSQSLQQHDVHLWNFLQFSVLLLAPLRSNSVHRRIVGVLVMLCWNKLWITWLYGVKWKCLHVIIVLSWRSGVLLYLLRVWHLSASRTGLNKCRFGSDKWQWDKKDIALVQELRLLVESDVSRQRNSLEISQLALLLSP